MKKIFILATILTVFSSNLLANDCHKEGSQFLGNAITTNTYSCDEIISSNGSGVLNEEASVCISRYTVEATENNPNGEIVIISANINDDLQMDRVNMEKLSNIDIDGDSISFSNGTMKNTLEMDLDNGQLSLSYTTERKQNFGAQKSIDLLMACEKI
jgi:hypothetical protein